MDLENAGKPVFTAFMIGLCFALIFIVMEKAI
jgi:hypothetical protein